jgi:hypothetical protein
MVTVLLIRANHELQWATGLAILRMTAVSLTHIHNNAICVSAFNVQNCIVHQRIIVLAKGTVLYHKLSALSIVIYVICISISYARVKCFWWTSYIEDENQNKHVYPYKDWVSFVQYKKSVRTSQETYYVSATKPNRLMLLNERVSVYYERHMKQTNKQTNKRPVGRIQNFLMSKQLVLTVTTGF